MAYGKTYVVFEGRHPGIYETWDDCRAEIEGYPGAIYKSYYDPTEAVEAFRRSDKESAEVINAIARHVEEQDTPDRQTAEKEQSGAARPPYLDNPEIIADSIAVDAGCRGNPGVMDYRGVDVRTGCEIFHVGPFAHGTNNIGEFLAIVHALALLKKQGRNCPVYSDSSVAQKWVRSRRCNTRIERRPDNVKLLQIVERAELWLRTNNFSNPILKWQTDRWGEIPADFGRKK